MIICEKRQMAHIIAMTIGQNIAPLAHVAEIHYGLMTHTDTMTKTIANVVTMISTKITALGHITAIQIDASGMPITRNTTSY
jgi:hypothetical protein